MHSPYKYLLLSLLLLCFCSAAMAQDNGLIQLSGAVTDDESRVIAYASVKVSNSTIGTITNADGSFTIQVPRDLQDHFLTISYIGYQSAKVSIKKNMDNAGIIVILAKSAGQLKEVVVSGESAAGIVAHAYRNINQNYPQSNTLYTGFYRESNFNEGNYGIENYNYVIEAVVKMNKPSYLKTNPEGDIKIEQSRRKDFSIAGKIPRWYAGAYTPIRFDVAKKRFDFIDPAHFNRYVYTREESTTYYDEPVYVIGFLPQTSARYQGTLYIDMRTYAIVKVDYQLTPIGLQEYNAMAVVTLEKREFKVNYQPIGSKWYLQSIWQQATGKNKRTGPFRYSTEYATTQIDTDHTEAFTYADRLQFSEVLSDKPLAFNRDFWDNYNIVTETQQLKELLIDTTVNVANMPSPNKADTLAARPVVVEKPSGGRSFRDIIRYQPVITFPFLNIVHTNANTMAVSYANPQGHTLINQQIAIKPSDLSLGYGLGYDFNILKNTSFVINIDQSFGHVDYSADNLGLIYRIRLSPAKARPLKLLLGMDYSFVNLSKKLDNIPAVDAPLNIDGKNFNNAIGVKLASKQQTLTPHLGLSLEINRLLSFYVKGSYYIPLTQTDELDFTDKPGGFLKSLFATRGSVPLNSPDVNFSVNGQPATRLPYRDDFSLSMGLVGTIRFKR